MAATWLGPRDAPKVRWPRIHSPAKPRIVLGCPVCMDGVNRPAAGSPGSPTCHSVPNVRPLGIVSPCPHPALWSPSVQRKSPRRPKTLPAQVLGWAVVQVHLAHGVLPRQMPKPSEVSDKADHDRCITHECSLVLGPCEDRATCSKAHRLHQDCPSSQDCVARSRPSTSLAVSTTQGLPCRSTCLAIASAEAQLHCPFSTTRSNVRHTSSGTSHDISWGLTWAMLSKTDMACTKANKATFVAKSKVTLPIAKPSGGR